MFRIVIKRLDYVYKIFSIKLIILFTKNEFVVIEIIELAKYLPIVKNSYWVLHTLEFITWGREMKFLEKIPNL